jgi:uncharacterized protein DUF732
MATMALMAEPVPAADDTVARNADPTVGVPNSTPTDAVDLAWSRDDDERPQGQPPANRESWLATWRRAGVLLLGGLALAGAIVLAFWLFSPQNKASQKPAGATPTPSSSAPAKASSTAAGPSSIVSTPDQDNKYVQALNDKGISFANPEAAVYNGKMVCDDIRQGMTVPQIVDAFRASNPALGTDADTYVSISVHAYCPQNSSLVGGAG